MDETLKLIAQTGTIGGILAIALFFLGRIVMRVAERMIAAIDRLGAKVDEHTADETAHVGQLRADVAVIKDRLGLDPVEEETPTPVPGRRRTPPFGVPRARTREGG